MELKRVKKKKPINLNLVSNNYSKVFFKTNFTTKVFSGPVRSPDKYLGRAVGDHSLGRYLIGPC